MGILLGSAHGKVIIDASGVKTGTGQAISGLESLAAKAKQVGTSLRNVGLALTLGLTLAILGIGKAAVMMASDLEETGTKVQAIFGDMSESVMAWSETSERALGMSQTQALDAAASFGVFGKAADLAGDDLTGFAESNVQLASDFASFWNTSPEEAIIALGAAFRGETEPIRRYGVLLNQAAVQAKAVEMGLIGVNDELTNEARILATNALIWEQTTDAQGDFARTSEGLANQLRITKAEMAEVGAILGKELLPYVKAGVKYFRELLGWFKSLSPEGRRLVIVIALIVAAIGPLLVILGTLISSIGTVAGVLAGISLPMIAAVAAIIGAILLLKVAWDNNWGQIRDKFFSAWAEIRPQLMLLRDWLRTRLISAGIKFAEWWKTVLLPAMVNVARWIADNVIPLLARLALWLATHIPTAIRKLSTWWKTVLLPAIQAVWAWMNTTLFPLLARLWGWLQINIPLALQTLATWWKTVLLPAIQAVWAWMNTTLFPLLARLWGWLQINIPLALQTLATWWKTVLLPAIQAVWAWLNATLFPFLQNLATFIGMVLVGFIGNLAAAWNNVLWPAILAVWAWLNATLFPFLRALGSFIGTVFNLVLTAMAGIWQNVLWPAIQKVFNILKTDALPIFQKVGDYLDKVFGPAIESIATWVGENLVRAFDGLSKILDSVTDWLNAIIEKLKEIELPSWMTPGSPTPWEMGLRGVRDELAALARMSLPQLTSSLSLMPAPAFAPTGAGGPLSGGGGGNGGDWNNYGTVIIKAESINNPNDLLRVLRVKK